MDQLGQYTTCAIPEPGGGHPPVYKTHESERETETERESERQATRGRATRPGQPGAPVTRRAAARDTVLRIPQA